ncbi:hypothetical protein TWF730_011061 [Orbilia blumenaviensis]|uniref:Uncharacterized protein n=1 Tax=Orbilia blumenaviensis TaxID=1796055 RepID=A0AAV9UN26_9PEZI
MCNPDPSRSISPEGTTPSHELELFETLHQREPVKFLEKLSELGKEDALAWLARSTSLVGGTAPETVTLLQLLHEHADSKHLADVKYVSVRGISLPLVGRTCILAALLSFLLQPPRAVVTVPERLRYLRASVRMLHTWSLRFVNSKQKMPATICGIICCPGTGDRTPEIWMGTTPPRGTGASGKEILRKASKVRIALAKGTGIWATKVAEFPVGSCAETFPLSVLLTSPGISAMYSLSVRNKDVQYIEACLTCRETLARAKKIRNVTILDMALPAFASMYGEDVSMEDGLMNEGNSEDMEEPPND